MKALLYGIPKIHMHTTTIRQLNQLNRDFYQQTSQSFHQSRQYFWEGWDRLKPYLLSATKQTPPATVVDMGCGSGRFADFIAETLPTKNWQYLGLDMSQALLTLATETHPEPAINFESFDLVTFLQGESPVAIPPATVLSCFGVTHHIPSQQLRSVLLSKLSQLLQPDGIICISFWQFMDEQRYQDKVVPATSVGISPTELEPHDYILDWQRGSTAYRYCHYWDEAEISDCVTTSGLTVLDDFRADSKSGQANRYLVLQKQL